MVQQSLIVALGVITWWSITSWDGMIFSFLGKYIEKKFPETIYKAICGCPICAGFWIGSAIYFIIYWEEFINLYNIGGVYAFRDWFGTILGCMGINVIVVKFMPENWYYHP